MAKLYRIRTSDGVVGCIAATSEDVARAYAIGKYDAGAEVERVTVKAALSVTGVCVLVSSHVVVHSSTTPKAFRVIE